MRRKQQHTISINIFLILSLLILGLPACTQPEGRPGTLKPGTAIPWTAIQWTATQTPSATLSPTPNLPSPTQNPPSITPSQTFTPGPSPTSTALPPPTSHSWRAQPIMIELAQISADPLNPNRFTPFFLLYGDGLMIIRSCEAEECRFLQSYLEEAQLCQLINAIDRSGFLAVDPQATSVPEGSGNQIRLTVRVYKENSVQILDLDRWVDAPNWYEATMGCFNCYDPPIIDPAIINVYRLLTTYPSADFNGMKTDRLAVWLSQPVIAGTPQTWDEKLISLQDLAIDTICPGDSSQRQAVVLDGPMAFSVSSFLSNQDAIAPIFTDGKMTWQVTSRWLLPYEMPGSCQGPPGMLPPEEYSEILWHCDPGMGAIPTPTATITPTPSITPTPLR